MTKYKIIADDLTGANANCSLMKKIGLDAATLLDPNTKAPDRINVSAYTTDSRAMDPDSAYDIVKTYLKNILEDDTSLYSKRIDSTLRGNLGPEISAFFDVLGDDYMGICVPAYPNTNRQVAQGIMYVNGKLLINSDAGRDTKTPVDSSRVKDLIDKNLKYQSRSIFIDEIEKGPDYLADLIEEEYQGPNRLLIFDGMNNDHIKTISQACIKSKVKFFAVDPGPFSLQVADDFQEQKDILQKVLFVVGSVTDTTFDQLNELLEEYDMGICKVDAKELAYDDTKDVQIKAATNKALQILEDKDFLLITTSPYDKIEDKLNLKEISADTGQHIDDISINISDSLAQIARNTILNDHSFAGVFMSGGDITVSFAKFMESSGIEIREEVIPLAAYGRMIGGLRPGLRIISKGGMVGDKDAMKICMEKLKSI